jgi:hypothetical protein
MSIYKLEVILACDFCGSHENILSDGDIEKSEEMYENSGGLVYKTYGKTLHICKDCVGILKKAYNLDSYIFYDIKDKIMNEAIEE